MKESKTKYFPFGIFIFLFMFLIIASTTIIAIYFRINTKEQIRKIEDQTHKYTSTIIDACEQIINSGKNKRVSINLNKFFKRSKTTKIYYKAFYVLKDGKIIAHSNTNEKKLLKGNIATDQLTYNLAQIFSPIDQKISHSLYLDYNILEIDIPFKKKYLKFLKKYIYNKIDINGWLVTKAISQREKKIGTINIIISKNKVYQSIFTNISFAKRNAIRLYIFSFVFSFIFCLLLQIRYQSLKIKILDSEKREFLSKKYSKQKKQYTYNPHTRTGQLTEHDKEFSKSSMKKVKNKPTKVNYVYEESEEHKQTDDMIIHDAIPIRSRRPR